MRSYSTSRREVNCLLPLITNKTCQCCKYIYCRFQNQSSLTNCEMQLTTLSKPFWAINWLLLSFSWQQLVSWPYWLHLGAPLDLETVLSRSWLVTSTQTLVHAFPRFSSICSTLQSYTWLRTVLEWQSLRAIGHRNLCEPPLFQSFNHLSGCKMQGANRPRNPCTHPLSYAHILSYSHVH